MKKFLNSKFTHTLLLLILSLILLPCSIITTSGLLWYTLPSCKNTFIGEMLLNLCNESLIFWVIIGTLIFNVILIILQVLLTKNSSVKVKNFFLHLDTILICILCIIGSIMIFILTNPLIAEEVIITIPRKIGISMSLFILIILHIFSGKIKTIINRKLQAYDTALEMNDIGRSSIILTNILKLLELLFPEMIVLLLVCFCVSWNIASYFVIILISCVVPIIGNIICDFNIRKDILRRKVIEQNTLVNKIVNNLPNNEENNKLSKKELKQKRKMEKKVIREQKRIERQEHKIQKKELKLKKKEEKEKLRQEKKKQKEMIKNIGKGGN